MDLQLASVIDALEDGIVVADEQLRPVWLNRAGGKFLGIDPCSVRAGSPSPPRLTEFLGRLGLAPGTEAFGGAAGRGVQRLHLSRDGGESIPVEVVVTRGQLGGRTAVIASVRDVSVQEQMERAVYDGRKTQAIGALASGIAHDFNNILTAVISQIDLVLYGGEIPAQMRQHLIYAQTSARRGAELVSKLQAFSRQSPPKFEVVNLSEVLEQALFMLRRGITPTVEIQAPSADEATRVWQVRADTNQLLQVILNMGINARDAMPKGGTISFALEARTFAADSARPPRRAGDFVCLHIRDTGQGMAPDVVARVFEPYFSTKDLSHGPGLGLSIAASVIAEHKGWVEVTSREGAGSCFSIHLPRCETPAETKRVVPVEVRPAEGRERILIVDDEELVRMVTKAILAYRGYVIAEAADGEEAVQKYTEADPRFDLVLMDLHMPRLNGYDALQRIRAINPKLKAILLSGGSQDPSTMGGDIEGVAYLQKPFDNQELASVVRRQLDA